MFVHLNVHSSYSLGWGCASAEMICRSIKEMGCPAIAITDSNNLYNLLFFIQYARENGLQPIVGAEVASLDNTVRATLLVRNREGYSNLCQIITARQIDPDFDVYQVLHQRHEGLVILTDDIPLLSQLRSVTQFLYAELIRSQPNRKLLRFAHQNGIKPVATSRAFWIKREDSDLHRLLRAIQLNCTFSDLKPQDYLTDAILCDEREMRSTFDYCPEAVDNSLEVAELCKWTPDFGIVYPEVEPGMNGNANSVLRDLVYSGAHWRYDYLSKRIRERIEHELTMIEQKAYAPIFLVVKDIVEQSSLTCGRGSAAASIVSYCLGITHVDPIKHKLFFERFINPARQDPPDIDVDFAWDERDDVLAYVFDKYGETFSAMVSNHVTFKRRMAIRETAKVFGLPQSEINEVTKKLGYGYSLTGKQVSDHPALKDHGFYPFWHEILSFAQRLKGIPRHLSVHCGGVVITPTETANWVPTEMAAKGVRILHWEKDQTEDSGLVKIDILGNRSLAVIRDSLKAVKEHYGVELDYKTLNPLDDPKTQDLIARGDTFGVFYVESPATRLLAMKAGKGDYEHLIIHSSVIRPAANRFINEYLQRIHGEPWESLHPLIGDILDDNYGIMCYQEDVTRVAMSLAGFDIAEGDELRKILSKKHKQRRLEDLKRKFYQGAFDRGVEHEVIDKIWDMIMSFAGYSFCKPHSASYALVSFKSAYVRAHYPAEFIAAVISNGGGYYSTMAYVSEARRMGLTILPPDVNRSEIKYVGRDNSVRVGLMQVKGLSADAQKRIIDARCNRFFSSFDDLLKRGSLKPNEAKLLIQAGCCDDLEPDSTRPELMWRVTLADNVRLDRGQGELFATESSDPPDAPEYDEQTLLQLELDTLGFLISKHPLELYQDRLKNCHIVSAINLINCVDRHVETVGWMVTGKMVLTNMRVAGWEITGKEDESKPQEPMEFVTFEDMTGLIETVIFPKVYKRYGHMLNNIRPYRLFGKVEQDFGAVTLTVDRILLL